MATSAIQRVEDYAGQVEQVLYAPEDDFAAVVGIDAAIVGGLLLGAKMLAWGFWYEFKKQ